MEGWEKAYLPSSIETRSSPSTYNCATLLTSAVDRAYSMIMHFVLGVCVCECG